ncbi:hypothetical protein TCAL_06912 [Tigriopus californicus]|uniref:Uncharacterized protein n=2 Tax=Tigriopus californicus TaxID=6832 RepID=A0A553PJW8_TIGCA|nr:hypothetical protein TCAL_06912 [Tigriopus californicus]
MKKLLRCYSQVLSNYPFGIMLAITSISITALVLSVTLQDLPDFSDPQAGFLTRGTEIARRLTAYENLLDSVSHIGPLTTNPLEARSLANKGGKNKGGKRKRRKKNRNGTKQGDGPYKKRNGGKRHRANSKDDLSLDAQNINAPRVLPSEEEQLSMDLDPSVPRYGIQREDQRPLNVGRAYVRNKRNIVEPQAILSSSQHRDIGWMCGEPMADYAHVVFKSNR